MSHRRAFTLIEVLVAITIGAIVILGARAILQQIADTADRLSANARDVDRRANTDRAVRDLFRRTLAADSAYPFIGMASRVRFGSWCPVAAGWLERCAVRVTVMTSLMDSASSPNTTPAVIVQTSAGDTLTLGNGARAVSLRYVQDAADGGHRVGQWTDSLRTPLAVELVTTSDTTVWRIGSRR